MNPRLFFLYLMFLLSGCSGGAAFQPTPTISHIHPDKGYRVSNLISDVHRNDPIFINVMFSGGGSRAAAFGYAVLQALQAQSDAKGANLLEHVGLTFGVSGGSVISMYYALHGKEIFPKFEQTFLKQNFQSSILEKLFSSDYLMRLSSAEFGRGDLLARQFDERLFHGITFAELLARGKGPMSIITASDFSNGHRFNFVQDYFDILCLDLGQYPIARAVAASSAVPIIFTPITLNNHAGHCNYRPSPLIRHAEQASKGDSEPTDLAAIRQAFSNRHKRPYLHLVDGGLSDNLGLRTLLDFTRLSYQDDALPISAQQHDKLIFISVDAALDIDYSADKSAEIPPLSAVISKAINNTIDRYSHETVRQFEDYLNRARDKIPAKVYFIRLNLADLPPSPLRDKIQTINTRFQISTDEINALKQAVKQLLKQSKAYQRLLRDLYS